MFQFPSNGKAYPKFTSIQLRCVCRKQSFNSLQTGKRIQRLVRSLTQPIPNLIVSIPFKRESVSKDTITDNCLKKMLKCFNSLQTGKRIQRHVRTLKVTVQNNSFNSLQTGKAYPKLCLGSGCRISSGVSIPFKRESVSKVFATDEDPVVPEFQFPSNGKAYPKDKVEREEEDLYKGFNSLQTGKRIQSL